MAVLIPGAKESITVGGRVFTDLPNLILLQGFANTAGNITTPRAGGATAGYVVPSAKTLKIQAVRLVSSTNTISRAYLLYGDTDVGMDSGSLPTTPIYLAGGGISIHSLVAGAANAVGLSGPGYNEIACDWRIPTGKYPAVGISGGGVVYLFGYLI